MTVNLKITGLKIDVGDGSFLSEDLTKLPKGQGAKAETKQRKRQKKTLGGAKDSSSGTVSGLSSGNGSGNGE